MVTVTYARQGWEVDNPGITKHLEIIQEYAGIDSASNLTIVGQMVGEKLLTPRVFPSGIDRNYPVGHSLSSII